MHTQLVRPYSDSGQTNNYCITMYAHIDKQIHNGEIENMQTHTCTHKVDTRMYSVIPMLKLIV